MNVPNLIILSSDSSTDTKNSLDFTSGVASSSGVDLVATGHYQVPGLPPLDGLFSAGSINFTPSYLYNEDHFNYLYQGNLEWDANTYDSFSLNYFYYEPFSVTFTLQVPSGVSGFEADFSFLNFNCQQRNPAWSADNRPMLKIYFDDTLIDSWQVQSGRSLADNVFYSFPSKDIPSQVRIVIEIPEFLTSDGLPDTQYADSGNIDIWYYVYWRNDSYFDYYWLSADEVLQGHIDDAQNDIDSHESIESEWTGSMESNFDALQMENFTFPSGLVSGFGLITGIFFFFWNAMGEYKILFVFPLTLGVALLLIGRISKFSGGQSSSRSNRGDDGA